jgi:hypothetical protein
MKRRRRRLFRGEIEVPGKNLKLFLSQNINFYQMRSIYLYVLQYSIPTAEVPRDE